MNVEEFLNSPTPPVVLETLLNLLETMQASNAALRIEVGALMRDVKKLKEEINDLHVRIGARERRKMYDKTAMMDKWDDIPYSSQFRQDAHDADMERKREKIKEILAELKIKKT